MTGPPEPQTPPDGVDMWLRRVAIATLTGLVVFVVVGDRVGPHFFERWATISDFSLLIIVAAMVSLVLGYAVSIFRRNGDGPDK